MSDADYWNLMGLSKLSLHDLCSHVSEIKKIARPDHSEHALVFIWQNYEQACRIGYSSLFSILAWMQSQSSDQSGVLTKPYQNIAHQIT